MTADTTFNISTNENPDMYTLFSHNALLISFL